MLNPVKGFPKFVTVNIIIWYPSHLKKWLIFVANVFDVFPFILHFTDHTSSNYDFILIKSNLNNVRGSGLCLLLYVIEFC